jgi:PAS domain S-box-containing protein
MRASVEIRLAEELAPGWAGQFSGWTPQPHPAGGTLLRGTFPDQAALFDVLEQVRALGLTLAGVVLLTPRETDDDGTRPAVAQTPASDADQRIFDALSDGLAIRDREGRIVDANPAYCQLYGSSREAILGTIADPPFTSVQRPAFDDYLATVNAGNTFRSSGWQEHASGRRIHVELRAVPFRYRGAPHILDLVRDTTEQVLATELAEQRGQLTRTLIHTLFDVSRQVTTTRDLEPLLRVMLTHLRTAMPFTAATFNLYHAPDQVELMLYDGPIAPAMLPRGWRIGPERPPRTPLEELIREAETADPQAFGREVIYSGAPVIIPDVTADTALARAFRARIAALLDGVVPEYIGCWMGVPLLYRGEVIGMLDFDHEQPGAFSERHARIALVAASQAATAISNTRLLAEVQGMAAQAERQNLARELHDAVTQQLFSASLIGEVLPQIWAADPAKGAEYLEDLRLLTKGALAEMRALLVELRPAALTDTPLPDLLQHLTAALSGRARVPVELQVEGATRLPDDVQVVLYRIAQEALHNVAKHARAKQVWVHLTLRPDAAVLSVRDDGRGFDPTAVPANHFGLAIMRERMAAVGGTVALESVPGQGTRLVATWEATAAGAVPPR